MKNCFLLFFCLIYNLCSSQIVINGNVYTKSYTNNLTELNQAYEVYLLKEDKEHAEGKLKLSPDSSRFLIELSKEELEIYSFLEFKYSRFSKVILIPKENTNDLEVVINTKISPGVKIKKPAIYLYPKSETEITIKHNFKGNILTTYPEYDDGWKVIANPQGQLFNLKDKRTYNYLFWDGEYTFPIEHFNYKEGFYVSKENYTEFLQEKLSYVGLNQTEINDFIVYWLPELNKYENCFIYFRINDNIGSSSILDVNPKPDVSIRLFMEFKEYTENQKLSEQKLPQFKRNNFVLVEWGGMEIESKHLK